MSADNWAVCPACMTKAKDDIDVLDIKFTEDYGQVPVETYQALQAQRHQLVESLLDFPRNLREDYEIRIDETGMFSIAYGANCTECAFQHSFRHNQQQRVEWVAKS